MRVAPYCTFGTPELAQVTLDALQGRTAALMANHGAITYAHDLEHAVKQSLLLEWGCRPYWHARAIGTPRQLTDEDQHAVIAAAVERRYGTTQAATE